MFNDLARHINKHGYLTPKQLQAWRKLRKNGTPRLAKYQANCDAPDDIATIYHLGPLYNLGYFGNGRSIAVIGQSDFYLADIAAFRAMFNLPPNVPTTIPVPPVPTTIDLQNMQEADLDLELTGAIARSANLLYVYSNDFFSAVQYAMD